ncbi:MAG: hypothetical protein AAGJ35_03970, partial [Myxococcota bacterium]
PPTKTKSLQVSTTCSSHQKQVPVSYSQTCYSLYDDSESSSSAAAANTCISEKNNIGHVHNIITCDALH